MKLCTVQPHMSDTIDANVAKITRWIRKSAAVGADVVVFPEMMLTGYDHHLHGFFKDTGWHAQVDEALNELGGVVDEAGTSALFGLPYPFGEGHLNALMLVRPKKQPILAGARSHLFVGDRNRWGFVEPIDRTPEKIQGISLGSIFCAEAHHLEYTIGKGLECSDVILWPGVIGSDFNKTGEIIRDWNVELARKIAGFYKVAVIQSNYLSNATDLNAREKMESNRMLGGSVACDATGRVLDQASRTDEEMRSFEISRINGAVQVTPLGREEISTHPVGNRTI